MITLSNQPGTPIPRPRRTMPDNHVAVWHDDEQRYRIHSADTAPIQAIRPGAYLDRYDLWRDQAANADAPVPYWPAYLPAAAR